ncbi:MAG: prepilin-type N-terminal cleavage/methylation domain-containing protein [Candidatus Omnitrophica bacterium]|nr:prepilin-type N-terminal cleavage/methylation domain-containing protein [Candidatus Omnitrophota bacterium]
MTMKPIAPKGFTLMEVMIGAILFAVVAAGAMMAIMSTARMSKNENNTRYAEASALAQQTIERLRNHIACDDPAWFDANCNLIAQGWQADNIADARGSKGLAGPLRCYRVRQLGAGVDCPGGGCIAIDVQICWNTAQACGTCT